MNLALKIILSIFTFIVCVPIMYVAGVFIFCLTPLEALPFLFYCSDIPGPNYGGLVIIFGGAIAITYFLFWAKKHRQTQSQKTFSKEEIEKYSKYKRKFRIWRNIFIGSIVLEIFFTILTIYVITNAVVEMTILFVLIWLSLVMCIYYYFKSK